MWQISLSGTGGQSLILAGIILAEAAILDGKQTIQTQSYGMEARGGANKSEVLISDQKIDYPKASTDILLAMSQESCDKYIGLLKEGGQLIVDTTLVKNVPDVAAKIWRCRLLILPATSWVMLWSPILLLSAQLPAVPMW